VRPVIAEVEAARGKPTNVASLLEVKAGWLQVELGRHADWQRYDARNKQFAAIDAPFKVASGLVDQVGDWRFPTIAGVISTPTMRPDGSLLLEPGYDPATRLLLVAPPAMPPIPDKPTREDALAALALIEDLLAGFPLVDDVARAVALSAILTPILRGAFPVAPMHASRAPTAGSGKSFLWDLVAAIAIGQAMPVMSTGGSEEELEKRLGAAMLAGQPLISIDNISGELAGDALCQIIERPVVEIRILGRSERVRIEARGTSTYATGNNFTIVGDLTRRIITVNLDPGVERPELREFKFDPLERVLADRGKYIAAALTIGRAYVVAGRPGKVKPLASFEPWSDLVRSSLIWLGKADAIKSMEAAREEDPERIELSEMLEAWDNAFGTGQDIRLKLKQALDLAVIKEREHEHAEWQLRHPDLVSALEGLAYRATGKRSVVPDTRTLGNYLSRHKGRIVDSRRFMVKSDTKHGSAWWVEPA
jgi:hypothetical protein